MIPTEDIQAICEWAQRYDLYSVYLFGSSLEELDDSNDIDIGVEGIPRSTFFELTGKLDWVLSKPVDVVDLDSNNPFAMVVRKYGRQIYGRVRGIS
ncbi:nucleotidyltransferase domain-containing protein [bacterium]|nr:nucleotidyltransferase domain-containing protein [bacterium]MBU1754027.1 nucleotidyltransferase domain-containing protein [bacterium]